MVLWSGACCAEGEEGIAKYCVEHTPTAALVPAASPIPTRGDPSRCDEWPVARVAGFTSRWTGIVFVSNHGGRVLDTEPATIEVLPAVVDRVAGRLPVLFDSGIRRGTDVLKGLACGASAVLIGRPYIYGLSVAGADGVRDVVNILGPSWEAQWL